MAIREFVSRLNKKIESNQHLITLTSSLFLAAWVLYTFHTKDYVEIKNTQTETTKNIAETKKIIDETKKIMFETKSAIYDLEKHDRESRRDFEQRLSYTINLTANTITQIGPDTCKATVPDAGVVDNLRQPLTDPINDPSRIIEFQISIKNTGTEVIDIDLKNPNNSFLFYISKVSSIDHDAGDIKYGTIAEKARVNTITHQNIKLQYDDIHEHKHLYVMPGQDELKLTSVQSVAGPGLYLVRFVLSRPRSGEEDEKKTEGSSAEKYIWVR
jgi:hypothetical protein